MEDLVKRIRDAIGLGQCVPFVGAGASIEGGGPSWQSYLSKLKDGLPSDLQFEGLDPADAASYLESERTRFGLPPVPVSIGSPTLIHHVLASWECPLYVTTNYDDGMELALRSQFADHKTVLNDQLNFSGLLEEGNKHGHLLVKLCSSSGRVNAMTREDFAYLVHRDQCALEFVVTLLRCRTVMFVGCSMQDPLIKYALDRAYALRVGQRKHVALLPDDYPKAQRNVLEKLGVLSLEFCSDDKSKRLSETLVKCKRAPRGVHHLIVFEPGTPTKMRQIIDVLDKCSTLELARIAVLTENPVVAQIARSTSATHPDLQDNIKIDVFPLPNLGDIESVKNALQERAYFWDSIFTPYEYAVANAAELAEAWNGTHSLKDHFHSVKVAQLSRDKRKFRREFQNLPDNPVCGVPFRTFFIEGEPSVDQISKKVEKAAQELGAQRVVIKPPDAAGSIGVRPLDVRNSEATRAILGDLVHILESMPVIEETARCDVSELIVEKRIEGEEFSVESRRVDSVIDTLAVHWKVDIDSDSDDMRFFERLFVTLPERLPLYERLVAANSRLLKQIGVSNGVFHAEFRIESNSDRIYPLEVGLRPGGGMVSDSVDASCGVNLFEAALRCAVRVQKNEPLRMRTVATGLVFPKKPGVLPPLGVRDGSRVRFVNHEDYSSLHEWLRQRLATTSRDEARATLERIAARSSELCRDVLSAFDETANEGVGLRVELKQTELLLRPGSLVAEEEASYVAGLLVVANEGLPPMSAVAESVAGMELCLNALVCEPSEQLAAIRWTSARVKENEIRKRWFESLADGGFQSDIDSFTFGRAIDLARNEDELFILDLGCGSARPAFRAVKQGCRYFGVDIDKRVISEARGNLGKARQEDWKVDVADVMDDGWLVHWSQQVDLLVANLPYLPVPTGRLPAELAREVDGGHDGLRFVPRVLTIAQRVRPSAVILNTSSLCNLEGLAREVERNGFGVHRAVTTLAHLGVYGQQVKDYLLQNGFSEIYGPADDRRQIIYAFELRRGGGIPVHTFVKQAESALKPALNRLGSMAIGSAGW